MPRLSIYFGDNLDILQTFPGGEIDLIYIDPPFNTGKVQRRRQIRTVLASDGDRIGFGDKRYKNNKYWLNRLQGFL